MKQRYRETIYKSMKRPFPVGSDLDPVLQLKGTFSKLAWKWHWDAFSVHEPFRRRTGLALYLDDFKLLLKQRPSKIDWMKI